MYGFSIKNGENAAVGGEGGDIDTSAPFRSVKAAFSLFGTSNSPKPKPSQDESVLEKKEPHLHLTSKEADNFKQLEVAENAKLQALGELEKANRTLHDLKIKLNNLSESKQAALHATEAAKARAKQLEESSRSSTQFLLLNDDEADVEGKIQEYYKLAVISAEEELNSAKQELTNLRQDYESAMEVKLDAFENAADAKHSAGVNRDKLTTLSKEIGSMRSTLSQVKVASSQAQEGHSRTMADKDARLRSKRTAKEGVEKRIRCFKDEYCDVDPQVLQEMLEETNEAILVLQDQLNTVRASDLDSLRNATLEVDDAKEKLRQVLKEKTWVGSFVELLKVELEKVRMDNKELMEKVTETSLLSQKLQVELVNSKEEREAALAAETKQGDSADSARSRIQVLSLEAANARKEADQVKRKVEALKKEAEGFRATAKLTEEKLMLVVAETGKEDANAELLRRNSSSSSRSSSLSSSSSSSSSKIRLTVEEFESLKGKAEKADAEREVGKAKAKVEEVNGREREARERFDEISEEIEDIKAATRHSLNQAHMAEAAKHAVETELLRNRMLLNPQLRHQPSSHSCCSSSSSSFI